MLVLVRRASVFVVAVLAGLSVVLVVPAGAAQALDPGQRVPVTFTGSMVDNTVNGFTKSNWNKVIESNPRSYPVAAKAGPSATKIGSTTVAGTTTALAGFGVGLAAGAGINELFGLPTTGSVLGDIGCIIHGTTACMNQIAGSPEYAPNADIDLTKLNGWTPSSVLLQQAAPPLDYVVTKLAFTRFETAVSGFGQQAVPVVTWEAGGQASGMNVRDGLALNSPIRAKCRRTSDGTYTVSTTLGAVTISLTRPLETDPYNPAGAKMGQTAAYSCPSGYTFWSWYVGSVAGPIDTVAKADASIAAGNATQYFPAGNPQRPPDQDPNPLRHWRSTWTCTAGAGGAANSASFHEADQSWPAFPSTPCASGVLSTLRVEQVTETATPTTTLVYDFTLPPEYSSGNPNPSECGGPARCDLELQRKTTPGGTKYASCFSVPAACADWWSETSKGTQATETSEYRCLYGSMSLPLTECAIYSHTFGETPVYSDPKTGEPPTTDTTPDPSGPDKDESCPPPFSWTSLVNPWWYYKGTVCALSEAFVPTAATTTAWTGFVGQVQSRPPGSIALGGLDFTKTAIAGLNGEGDCSTLGLDMGNSGPVTGSFDLCAAVKSSGSTTWGQRLRQALQVVLIGGGCWIAYHRVAKSIGDKA